MLKRSSRLRAARSRRLRWLLTFAGLLVGASLSAEAAAQNLLVNGDFEQNTASVNFLFSAYPSTATAQGWSAVNFDGELFDFTDVSAPAGPFYADLLQNGGGAMGIIPGNPRTPWNETSHNAAGIGYDRIVQLVDVLPNTTYTLTFYHRGGNRLDYVGDHTLIQFQSLQTMLYQDVLLETPDAWSPVSVTFRTDATTTRAAVLFSALGAGPSSVLLDGAGLRDASLGCGNGQLDAQETCDDGNLLSGDGCDAACQLEPTWSCGSPILNGGFELGSGGGDLTGEQLPGWTITAGTIDQGPQYPRTEGQRSIDLTGCSPGTISQEFTTVPGQAYTLSLDYGSNTYANNSFEVELRDVATGDVLASQTFTADPTVGNALLTGSVMFGASGAQTRLTLRTVNSQSCGGNWIDNVRLEAICFTLCGNGVVDNGGEGCDAGVNNGTSACGCQEDCTLPDAGDACAGGVCNGSVAAPACVECLDDGDCSGDRGLCDMAANVCVACLTGADCNDGNSCTRNLCEAGSCSFPAEMPRATCEDGGLCDGTNCVECLISADCSDGNDCTRDVCFDGSCSAVPEDVGTPCGDDGVCSGLMADPRCLECLTDAACDGDEVCTADQTCALPDSDGDGVRDGEDLDDDNDGIPDLAELGGQALSGDMDGDGVLDWQDADNGCEDADSDGRCDALPLALDADGDGIPNHLDLDADGDGIADLREGGGVDADGDGRVDGLMDDDGDGLHDPLLSAPLPLPDTDTDLAPDFLDRDSDSDGLTDAREGGAEDVNGDGFPDGALADDDGDGIADALTGAGALPLPDTDADNLPDYRDPDSDDDGVPDAGGGL
jgi:cysteine-rich repeat protein